MANIHTFSSINKNNNNNRPSSGQGRYATLSNSSPSSQDTSSDSGMFSISMPDENGGSQKVNILHVLFPGFKVKSFVFYLSMFQIALFLVTRLWGWAIPDPFASSQPKHNDPFAESPPTEQQDDQAFNCVLYKFGAKYTPAIVGLYQIQRLLLPVFLHAGFGHVFFNMLSQWLYGFHLEQLYSTKKFIILYFASAIGGNLLSGIQNTDNISVGASSALFGIFAFQVAYLIDNYENLGPRKNIQIFVIAMMLLANVGSATSEKSKIDNSAHLGGFLAGGLIAIYYMGSNAESKFKNYHKKAIILFAAYFIITSIWLASTTIKDDTGKTIDLSQKATELSEKCKTAFKLW